jgi:hypothetical protein
MAITVRNNLDLGLNQLLSAVVETVASDPATPTAGRIIYNTTGNTFKIGNGTSWVSLTGGATGTVKKYAADITGNGTLTQFPVTHSLGSTDVLVQVWKVTSNAEIIVDKTRVDANTVRVDFAVAPTNGEVFRVVVMA